MLGEPRRDGRELEVGRQRDSSNLFVMVANEAHVPHQTVEVLPTRKLLRVNHEALELFVSLNVLVREQSELVEVSGLQGFLDLEHDHSGLRNQACLGGGRARQRAQPLERLA